MEETPDKWSQKKKITKVDFQNANITECPSVLLTSMDKTSTKTRVKLRRMQTCLLIGKELRDKVSSFGMVTQLILETERKHHLQNLFRQHYKPYAFEPDTLNPQRMRLNLSHVMDSRTFCKRSK